MRALLTCDRELAYNTLMNDPQRGAVSLEDGRALFEDMPEATRACLPEKWFR